jgi:hypothetical protein
MTHDAHAPAWARADSTLAPALEKLRAQINAHWPKRDHGSDGTIGDAAHLAEGDDSDHCPWLDHTVRAIDVDVDGIDAAWLAESLRRSGHAGDHRLTGGGYVIYAGKITTPDFSAWVHYAGADPHTSHVHVSATRNPSGFRDTSPWAFLDGTPAPTRQPRHPGPVKPVRPIADGEQVPAVGPHAGNTAAQAPAPVVDVDGPEPGREYAPAGHDAIGTGDGFRAQFGNEGPKVKKLQAELNRQYPAYSQIDEDGVYGENTAGVVEDFARRVAADPHCPDEYRDALQKAHGDNVGPALAAVFPMYGVDV